MENVQAIRHIFSVTNVTICFVESTFICSVKLIKE